MKNEKLATLLAFSGLLAGASGQLNFVHESDSLFTSEHLSNKAMGVIEEFITPEVFRGARITKVPEKPSTTPRLLTNMWNAFATYVPFMGTDGFVVMTAFTDDQCTQPVFETGRNVGGCFVASDPATNTQMGSFRVAIGNSFVEKTAITRMSMFDSFDCSGPVKAEPNPKKQYSFFSDKCMRTQYPDFGHGAIHSVSFAYDTNPFDFKLSGFFPQIRNTVDFDSYTNCNGYSPAYTDKRTMLRYFLEPNSTQNHCVIDYKYQGGMNSHSLTCNPATKLFDKTSFYFNDFNNPNVPPDSSGCQGGSNFQSNTALYTCMAPLNYNYITDPSTGSMTMVISEKKVGVNATFLDAGIPSNRAEFCDRHDHPAANPNLRWNDVVAPPIPDDDTFGFVHTRAQCPPFQNPTAISGASYNGYLSNQNYNQDFDAMSSVCVDGQDQFGNLRPFHLKSGDIFHVDACDHAMTCGPNNTPQLLLAQVQLDPTRPQNGTSFNFDILSSFNVLTGSSSPVYKQCANGCPSFTWNLPFNQVFGNSTNATTPTFETVEGDYVIVEACYLSQSCGGKFTYDLLKVPAQ